MRQRVVELELTEGQAPFQLVTKSGYEALKHFFEDVGCHVIALVSEVQEINYHNVAPEGRDV